MLKGIYCFLCFCLVGINPLLHAESPDITHLNDAQFESFIQKADKPVIIDFWAPWCPPCMKMKPIFEQLAKELKEQYLFVSVNIDESQLVAQKYGIMSIPTFKVMKNNDVLGTFIGYTDEKTFIKQIDNAIHKKTTQETLFSAIQTNDKELVAACLNNKDIDVNGLLTCAN